MSYSTCNVPMLLRATEKLDLPGPAPRMPRRSRNDPPPAIPRKKHPAHVARRNARERNRVREVNRGFVALRTHIPIKSKSKKLSKVETLRQAAAYIKCLQEILSNGTPESAVEIYNQFELKASLMSDECSNNDNDSPCSSPDPVSVNNPPLGEQQPRVEDLYAIDNSALLPPIKQQPPTPLAPQSITSCPLSDYSYSTTSSESSYASFYNYYMTHGQ